MASEGLPPIPPEGLADYSGPFRPDIKLTDFTKERLAEIALMANFDIAGQTAAITRAKESRKNGYQKEKDQVKNDS